MSNVHCDCTVHCDNCGGYDEPPGYKPSLWAEGVARNFDIDRTQSLAKCRMDKRMNLDQLIKHHITLCDEARELMQRKNHDYANGKDVFRNFRTFGRFGILVRLSDKLARLQSFMEKGELKVKDETVKDSLIDILNYAILFEAYEELDD